MDASRDVTLKVAMGDKSAAAMFSWYLDDSPLEKVRILAASQKQKCLPTLTDQTCVTGPGLSWGWVSPLSQWSRSQGLGVWACRESGCREQNQQETSQQTPWETQPSLLPGWPRPPPVLWGGCWPVTMGV